jgi:hypothetical protein
MSVFAVGAAGAIVAGGTIPALAATSGVRYAAVQGVSLAGPNSTGCSATVLSAAVSTGSPSYVSAMVENTLKQGCSGWLQSSVNGGPWQDVSPRHRVPANGPNYEAWYKTANYYAGPGTRIRACIQPTTPSGTTPQCSGPVSLAQSTAKPASDGTSLYYHRRSVSFVNGDGLPCSTFLNSSTKRKATTSHARLILGGNGLFKCTGWLESSTNNGKTWVHATSTYSLNDSASVEFAFSPAVVDGTGHLVRACVRLNARKKCTAGW